MAALCLGLPAMRSTAQDHDHPVGAATIKSEIVTPPPASGKSASTVIRLTAENGKPVTLDDLKVAHTEKLHLLIIDETLTDYHHEHPVPAEKPGEYRFDFEPKFGGTYHVWADLLPTKTGKQEYSKTMLKVAGPTASGTQTTNTTASVDGYRFDLSVDGSQPVRAGQPSLLRVKVTTPDGKDFAGLESVMGAFAHMVAFPSDLESVAHVHPMGKEPRTKAERGGPTLSFHVAPEKPGYHKIFLQTQIGGRDRFAAFGMNVEPADAAVPVSASAEHICPMHPEVKQKSPGRCPKCGMDLVKNANP